MKFTAGDSLEKYLSTSEYGRHLVQLFKLSDSNCSLSAAISSTTEFSSRTKKSGTNLLRLFVKCIKYINIEPKIHK